jgi:hypothetical protein
MPLGFERLNERVSRPNPLINFIKTLPGSTSSIAQDYLERIAAQCYPVMKANHIAVMALEEYEWNPEFIGRNFNAGEVVQLVLRSRSGAWLPFKYVQMTMMHELAHCKHMNHSGAFWKVRNAYAVEMRELWGKNYLGEGLWGKGQSLEGGRFMNAGMPDARELPEHTCGGTYRRRGRKRKRGGANSGKPQLSYAERKQKRILKKFGAGGVALGDDEDTRVKLEDGKKPKGKPRVAGSSRGRELRAAAALARFDQAKKEEIKKEDTDSDTEDEYDWPLTGDEASVQRDGKDFVRICEAEDEQDDNVKREMEEMFDLRSIPKAPVVIKSTNIPTTRSKPQAKAPQYLPTKSTTRQAQVKPPPGSEGIDTESDSQSKPVVARPKFKKTPSFSESASALEGSDTESDAELEATLPLKDSTTATTPFTAVCPVCSLENEPSALICLACSNVLKPAHMPNHWRCHSDACRDGIYINVGDYGRCQVCGIAKPS